MECKGQKRQTPTEDTGPVRRSRKGRRPSQLIGYKEKEQPLRMESGTREREGIGVNPTEGKITEES